MNPKRFTSMSAALALLASATTVSAQTIYVDTSNDVIDFSGGQQVADLPGPDGKISLPEAGLASDNTPGVQTIGFHIPVSDWQYQQFYPGRAVLRPFLGFRVFDTAILDATTQTAFTGDTYALGGEVVIWQETYMIDNFGGRAVGFDHSSLHLSGGANNTIQGNTDTGIEVYDSASNLIGGANPGQGNTGGFIQIDRANGNVVVGNITSRVRVLGWFGGGLPATNNRIGGPSLGERNFITGLGTLNSEGNPSGFAVQIFDTIGTVVENNWIGTTPDGLQPGHPWTTTGIYFDSRNDNTVIRNNRIAGILSHTVPHLGPGYYVGTAISVYGMGSGVTIVGNKIGLNANDQPVLGSVTGIMTANYYLGPVQNVVIGGTTAGEGNEIAGHLLTGISVANTYPSVRILGNSIHDNGGLGIDLITDGFATGVTPNDPLDADTGGNGLQNFPVIQSATQSGATVRVVGTLNSSPNAPFEVQFFASAACDSSGFGEGSTFLGRTQVTTNGAGSAAFDVVLPTAVNAGWFVTATATLEPLGATSEFSACSTIVADAAQSYCFGDGSGTACPCANNGVSGNGCASSSFASGANLSSSGIAGASAGTDSLILTTTNIPGPGLFFQGTSQSGGGFGTAFGDGLLCAGGTITRLGIVFPVGNSASYPDGTTPSPIHVAGATTAGDVRHYQCWYRDAGTFCTSAVFNTTNGIRVTWGP